MLLFERRVVSSLSSDFRITFRLLLTLLLVDLFTAGRIPVINAAESTQLPNIVMILADDMGYSDLGCYGSEIETPVLDQLAANGLRYTQFYNTARCWPTRAALLTGYYAQQVQRDDLPGYGGGGRGQRPAWAPLLPELLAQKNYRCYHSGKWHIDGPVLKSGFHRSFNTNNQGNFFTNKGNFLDDQPISNQTDSNYYATIATADHAIECLQEHARQYSDQPFFHYIPFIAPHFPLHALPADIDRYRHRYLSGWDQLRQERFEKQKLLGIHQTTLSAQEFQVGPPYEFPAAFAKLGPGEIKNPVPWNSLTATQQQFQAQKMAIHAAMIDRMDQEIGRIVDQLKQLGLFQNTIILFASDNGASAEIMVRNGGHDPAAAPGSAASYLCLGPGFSAAANTPFRRHKTWVHEGGISTPLVVHWPAGISAKGELRHTPAHVIDFVPTVLELIQLQSPEQWNEQERPPLPGKSLLPTFAKETDLKRESLWWLHEGNRAIRLGDWKLVAARNQPWELYNLKTDRAEAVNLASEFPDRVQQLANDWEKQVQIMQNWLEKSGIKKSESQPVRRLR